MLFHVEHIYIFYTLSKHLLDLIVSRGTIVQFVVRCFTASVISPNLRNKFKNYNF
jgi:hypothetical protein